MQYKGPQAGDFLKRFKSTFEPIVWVLAWNYYEKLTRRAILDKTHEFLNSQNNHAGDDREFSSNVEKFIEWFNQLKHENFTAPDKELDSIFLPSNLAFGIKYFVQFPPNHQTRLVRALPHILQKCPQIISVDINSIQLNEEEGIALANLFHSSNAFEFRFRCNAPVALLHMAKGWKGSALERVVFDGTEGFDALMQGLKGSDIPDLVFLNSVSKQPGYLSLLAAISKTNLTNLSICNDFGEIKESIYSEIRKNKLRLESQGLPIRTAQHSKQDLSCPSSPGLFQNPAFIEFLHFLLIDNNFENVAKRMGQSIDSVLVDFKTKAKLFPEVNADLYRGEEALSDILSRAMGIQRDLKLEVPPLSGIQPVTIAFRNSSLGEAAASANMDEPNQSSKQRAVLS